MCLKEVPYCNILGVKISTLSMKETVDFLKENINNLSGDYICVANVHTTVMSYDNDAYRSIQNGGVMALPDGGPLSTIAQRRGYRGAERVTGPDLMSEIFKISGQERYRHYFYGSGPETLKLLRKKLEQQYPYVEVAGMYSPPYRILTNSENQEVIRRINESRPDFIWVGLGAPKQEQWMSSHRGLLHGVMVGVGAGFDYHAGNLKRAPRWMQRCNLEWLYRLMQEPKRLLKRYIYTNLKFLWLIIRGK